MLRKPKYLTALLVCAALTAAVSCGEDRLPTSPRQLPTAGPNATLWDGSQQGGNPDVFFLPPLVPNPDGVAPTYGASPFDSGKPVEIEIACLTAPTGGSCTGRGLPRTPANLSNSDQQYQLNWDTKAPGFDPGYVFRIKVWIGSTNVAFADVLLISNANPKNKNTSDDIPLPDGRTLPIKVHVQQGWACINQNTCVTQVVGNTPPSGETYTKVTTNDGEDFAAFPANWFDPNVVGTNQVLVTIEDITPNVPSCSALDTGKPLTSMLSRNHCVRITTDPKVDNVTNSVIVATCVDNPGDTRQLILKYDVDEAPLFLRNVPITTLTGFTCPETQQIGMSHAANPMVRLASNALAHVGNAMRTLFAPKVAYAIDQGVGGSIDPGTGFSVFALAFPDSMGIESGNGQTGVTGSQLPLRQTVRLTALHTNSTTTSNAVVGASVTCTVTSPEGSFLVGDQNVGTAVATDNQDGTYSCPIMVLGSSTGTNTVLVTAAATDPTVRLEELGEEGSDIASFSGTATFTETVTAGTLSFVSVTKTDGSAFDGSALEVDGSAVSYIATIQNPGFAIPNVVLQSHIQQGGTTRAAGGTVLTCGADQGVLPTGNCVQNWQALANDTQDAGSGSFAAGSATLVLELWQGETLLASKSIPITLTVPTIGN